MWQLQKYTGPRERCLEMLEIFLLQLEKKCKAKKMKLQTSQTTPPLASLHGTQICHNFESKLQQCIHVFVYLSENPDCEQLCAGLFF